MKSDSWFLYILECSDGSYYTGVTKDLKRRLNQHNAGKGARYTRARKPLFLIYKEECNSYSEALVRERAVKNLNRKQKELLVLHYRSFTDES